MLITTGQAKCTRSAEDILEEYGVIPSSEEKEEKILPTFSSELQGHIYAHIQNGIKRPDALAEALENDVSTILLELSMMEISGYILLDTLGEYHIQ